MPTSAPGPPEKAHGKIWFAVQFLLFCAILIAPLLPQPALPSWLRPIGAITFLSGIVIAIRAYQTLGRSHSPWTSPIETATFVSQGIYSHIRHPIYAGWILGTFGLALLTRSSVGVGVAVALFVFYDFKSREEEKWLVKKYPGYPAYVNAVKRFIPFVY